MHEHLPRHFAPVTGASDRSFGLVFTIFFLIVGLMPLLQGHNLRVWSLGLAATLMMVTFIIPGVLSPLNHVWTKFGLLLHSVISPIALGILFYAVVTPTGLIMRRLGNDPLRLSFDRSAKSYWIARTPPGPSADSLKNQF